MKSRFRRWILTVWGFQYPITLTMWHMGFCSVVSFILVRGLGFHVPNELPSAQLNTCDSLLKSWLHPAG